MDFNAYRLNLLAAARSLNSPERYLSPPSALPDHCVPPVTLSTDHFRLLVWLTDQESRIAALRFEARGDDAALLAAFCEAVEALPLEEAAAYGADYAFLGLAREVSRPAHVGIVPVAHLLPTLAAAQGLLRDLRLERRPQAGMAPIGRARFLAVPESWQRLSASERLQHLRVSIAAYLKRQELPEDLVVADRLEDDIHQRQTRLIVTHARTDDSITLPPLMRALESHLRTTTAPWVELYAEERTDRNALRRTILTDLRKP